MDDASPYGVLFWFFLFSSFPLFFFRGVTQGIPEMQVGSLHTKHNKNRIIRRKDELFALHMSFEVQNHGRKTILP